MKTLFEELKAWRVRLAEVCVAVGLPLNNVVIIELDALLARHRESERWHHPAEGEVPPECTDVLTFRDGPDEEPHHNVEYLHGGTWYGVDVCRVAAPTRWRYLSPADVPEAE